MRYPDGGGLTAQGRSRREQVRLQAAQTFEHDVGAARVAKSLRVSTKSACQWRRAWRAGGAAALASKGPGGSPCKLGEDQLGQLRTALEAGPAAGGWDADQRWTLARADALIERLFGVPYTLRGVSYLSHRTGFTPRRPAPSANSPATSHRLRRTRHRPRLISGFFSQTRLNNHHRPRPWPFIFLTNELPVSDIGWGPPLYVPYRNA
jgi:transposase